MLTLSACETAVEGIGQNGKELEGFANLAQARGAQAVLATQWAVADESTAQLMEKFYQERDRQSLTKAGALRVAQLAFVRGNEAPLEGAIASRAPAPSGQLVAGNRGPPRRDVDSTVAAAVPYVADVAKPFAHPYYWAPFILMGNWL